jgi:hypothetical protein
MTDEARSDAEQTPFEVTDVLGGAKLEDGTGICLSGGGFRAMLFHLGSLIRLNELGLLSTIDRVSSVSGGSLAAGILAAGWSELDFDVHGVARAFHNRVSDPLLGLARKRVDVPAILLGFIPFVHAANVAAGIYDRAVFHSKTLQDLPERPRFTNAPLTAVAGGVPDILIENVSGGSFLAAGEYEIASILMKVKDESQSTRVLTIFELQIEAAPDVFYSSVDGYAFLSRQVAGA